MNKSTFRLSKRQPKMSDLKRISLNLIAELIRLKLASFTMHNRYILQ